jgi:hypothetical protein
MGFYRIEKIHKIIEVQNMAKGTDEGKEKNV